MTGVRHLLLAVVAAVLALALGLALGAGPVVGSSDATRTSREDRLAAQAARLQDRLGALEDRARTDSRVVAALSGPLTDGRLEGHSVLLVRTPGARDNAVRRTRAALLGAGASLTGELTITATYLDPDQASAPLEDLALRLVPPNVEFPPGATAIQRVGTVLARATVAAKPPRGPRPGRRRGDRRPRRARCPAASTASRASWPSSPWSSPGPGRRRQPSRR